jgi:hypothetical protein
LCPYHNPSGLNCTKSSVTEPLGVCAVYDGEKPVITCPVRLRQDLIILTDAAGFFFPEKPWVALTEARLKDGNGKSAGNIDIVLAVLDEQQEVTDFGAIEIQAVYISGNVSQAFNAYMKNPAANHAMTWPRKGYPTPDYLSSSRKRLVPQLMFKGSIWHDWGKKMAVVVQRAFFDQLPILGEVSRDCAELAWLIYDLKYDDTAGRFKLYRCAVKYTTFESALNAITTPSVGNMKEFVEYLRLRIQKRKIEGMPPDSPVAPTVEPLPDRGPVSKDK